MAGSNAHTSLRMLGFVLLVRLCGRCGQPPCVVFAACVVWCPLGYIYEAGTCSCCWPAHPKVLLFFFFFFFFFKEGHALQ